MYIFLMKWNRGEQLDEAVSMSLMAMIYFVFLSINSMTYWALTTFQTFLAIIFRMSTIFELEEYEFKRELDVPRDQVSVEFNKATVSWGFSVKQENAESSADKKKKEVKDKDVKAGVGGKLELDYTLRPIIEDVNLSMKRGDFLTVVGKVGSGKSTLLMSVMEETTISAGSSAVKGSVAYVE